MPPQEDAVSIWAKKSIKENLLLLDKLLYDSME